MSASKFLSLKEWIAANSFSTLLPADLIENYWNYRYGTSCPYETDRADVVYIDPNDPIQNKRYIISSF